MKKYVKPEIEFEDFALTTNIAAGCERIHNSTDGICPVYGSGGSAFFNLEIDGTNCFDEGVSDVTKDNDGFCYHVPADGLNLFTSG